MKKYLLSMLIAIAGCTMALGAEPDMLVTQSGEIFKVYNLDLSVGDKIYYTLDESEDAPLQKINKSDVFVLKKADGTMIDLSAQSQSENTRNKIHPINDHEDISVTASEIKVDKNGRKTIVIGGDNIITLAINSENTLEIVEAKIKTEDVIIPEYVIVDDIRYPITKVGKKAFKGQDKMITIQLPKTLKTIEERAFRMCIGLTRIILPENIESIGKGAFAWTGYKRKDSFKELYIPAGVKEIGEKAFIQVGNKTSYLGFFQGNLTGLPDMINISNCTVYGIDEEAVEAYEKRRK